MGTGDYLEKPFTDCTNGIATRMLLGQLRRGVQILEEVRAHVGDDDLAGEEERVRHLRPSDQHV